MAVRLKTNDGSIPVRNMRDGQIAEIIQWDGTKELGRIVQRVGENLICIGFGYGEVWKNVFGNSAFADDDDSRVRILKNGETLIIEDNE